MDISTTKRHSNRKRQLIQASPAYCNHRRMGLSRRLDWDPYNIMLLWSLLLIASYSTKALSPASKSPPTLKVGIPAADGAPFQLPQAPDLFSLWTFMEAVKLTLLSYTRHFSDRQRCTRQLVREGSRCMTIKVKCRPPQPSQESPFARSSFLGYGQPFMPPPLTNQFAVQPSIAATVYPGTNGLFYCAITACPIVWSTTFLAN